MSEDEFAAAYDARRPFLETLKDTLLIKTENALAGLPHVDRIAFRVKDRDSFIAKAGKSKYTDPLTQLEDQVAGRAITFFRDDIPLVRQRLNEWFADVEHEAKEPTEPKVFDYESDHYVFVIAEHDKPDGWSDVSDMPTTFEFQVRTLFMHAWAEPQHNLGYKPDQEKLDHDTIRELAWIAASAWGADRMLNDVAIRRGLIPRGIGPDALGHI